MAINSENFSAYFAAYTLGMISPKSNNRKVTITMVNKNESQAGAKLKSSMASVKKVDNITIPTFTKLLVINIVASKCSGFFNKSSTCLLLLLFSIFKLSRLAGDKEKKATSEPDTNAELNNKITMILSPNRWATSGSLKEI